MIAALLSALVLLAGGGAAAADRPVDVPAGGGVTLAGTLAVPPGPGPHPAAVLVQGFGPQDRDGAFGDLGNGAWGRTSRTPPCAATRCSTRPGRPSRPCWCTGPPTGPCRWRTWPRWRGRGPAPAARRAP